MSDFQVIFLVSTQQDQVSALLEALQAEQLVGTYFIDDLETLTAESQRLLPDLVLLYNPPGNLIQQVRAQEQEDRPVVVVITDDNETQRIQYLKDGADDVLDSNLGDEELRIRLLVHLRRNVESRSNPTSNLPSLPLGAKIFHRRVHQQADWALMHIEIDYFNVYSEVYGPLPRDQVLRTLASLLGQYVLFPDFVSHTDTDNFLILTRPEKAEKIASILCRQFDTAAPNFYSEKDRKQGYMISVRENQASQRIPLLTLSIGIVSNQTQKTEIFHTAMNTALMMTDIARRAPGSHWHSDKPKLTSAQACAEAANRPLHIMTVESDAALTYLLKTSLEMHQYVVTVASGLAEAKDLLAKEPIHLVVTDALYHGEPDGLDLCQHIRQDHPGTLVLCTSTLHDREQVLQAGADLYLPKPYDMVALFSWIDRLLRHR